MRCSKGNTKVAGFPFGVPNPQVQVEILVTWAGICLVKLALDPNHGTSILLEPDPEPWKEKKKHRIKFFN